MNAKLSSLMLLLFLGLTLNITAAEIILKISKSLPDKPIFVTLYSNPKTFLQPEFSLLKKIFPYNNSNKYLLKNIAPGNYAIAVFQDINGNEMLDKSILGSPNEPYGFSKNIEKLIGPPSIKDCLFKVSGITKIEVRLK